MVGPGDLSAAIDVEANVSRWNALPLLGVRREGLEMIRPIMQRGRVEVGATRPDQRLSFEIDPNLIEQRQAAQRPEQLSGQNRLKIDGLFRAIVESDAQRVWGDNLERRDPVDRMDHDLLAIWPRSGDVLTLLTRQSEVLIR